MLNASLVPNNEFGCFIQSCKDFLTIFIDNSHCIFSRSNANKFGHSLVKVTLFTARPKFSYDITSYIISTILMKMW